MKTWSTMLCLFALAALGLPASAQRDEQASGPTPVSLSFDRLVRTGRSPLAPEGSPARGLPEQGDATLEVHYPLLGTLDAAEDAEIFEQPRDVLGELGLSVARDTALRDGGIGAMESATGSEILSGYAEPNGEFELYDISVRLGELKRKDVGLSLLAGFRAIRAEVGQVSVSQDRLGRTTTTYRDEQGVVAVPVVGTGVFWNPSDEVHFRGGVSTHTISDATFFDLRAEAEIKLRYNVGLTAGYEYVHSVMQVHNMDARLSEAGLFARIQIKF
ncbi:MAG: hypothetical protein DYG94_03850 [Leptolyngbya sp. PLA3]|nr:MAG: hypothetical protein EDM82_08695 [Cyanobacteria bacterium CYA]MCE7967863.1 hypothetical protein [Leptolyngbya sp. PL-A3]